MVQPISHFLTPTTTASMRPCGVTKASISRTGHLDGDELALAAAVVHGVGVGALDGVPLRVRLGQDLVCLCVCALVGGGGRQRRMECICMYVCMRI